MFLSGLVKFVIFYCIYRLIRYGVRYYLLSKTFENTTPGPKNAYKNANQSDVFEAEYTVLKD